ncbi:hypothetical protein ASD11_14125 [Aeromicrobium sp. Root495]|uniref:ANTAR domain-containing protein n=1 Tax=Aeromicrobium sp. Root495 TaxID=1736550 RepID=UPI0006FC5279|nr:ANTAR domain-containing protein [Aeromicrobium sp. Root495]KQY55648.1 hypothetical protein ASD11_14125 [Aeromicrobium sp. Root495]
MTDEHQALIARLAAVLASLHAMDPGALRLCEAGRRMLDADGAALSVASSSQVMVVASTDDLAAQLEDLQETVGEGPSKDALREQSVQVAAFTEHRDGRRSLMHEHGQRIGFTGTMIAVPLRPRDRVIGTLTAYRQDAEAPVDHRTAEFLGVALGTALLQDPALGLTDDLLAEAWSARAEVHQATGMVISQVGVRPEDAMALLRGQAFANGTTLLDVARQIIQRRINFRDFTIEGD